MNPILRHTSQAANTLVPARASESRNPCLRLVHSRLSRQRLDFWLEHVSETAGRYQLRGVTGIIFMVFGMMKIFDTTLPILVGAPGLQVTTGAEGFARLIAGLGIPFPLLNAWMVIAVELLCGLGLILSAWLPATRLLTRLSALPLLGDMLVALLVGIREVQGNPVLLDGIPVMNQFWRLPLELGLLLSMAYLLWRPAPPAVVSRPVPVPVRVTEKGS
jgi:uncharacterized membrane protein YphA (DoxX/SURF4 family)